MKTIEQINQIKTLKALIAQMVDEHKTTKQLARSNKKTYEASRAQYQYVFQKEKLFVAYTTYYYLRHVEKLEDFDAYINSVIDRLKEPKRNKDYDFAFFGYRFDELPYWQRFGSLKDAVMRCIECLDKVIKAKEENKDENQ